MLSNVELIGRLVAAAAFGSVIGFERERLLWAAGLRTHMLVCVGACLFMIVSAHGFADSLGDPHVVLDPSRIAAQVVSGIGFLGAGTILFRGEVVRGLTTAASLWGVAAIGLAVGGGLYVAALAATAIVLAILAGVKPIEERYRDRIKTRTLLIRARSGELTIDVLNAAIGPRSRRVRQFVAQGGAQGGGPGGLDEVKVSFVRLSRTSVDEIARTLRALPCVESVEVDEG